MPAPEAAAQETLNNAGTITRGVGDDFGFADSSTAGADAKGMDGMSEQDITRVPQPTVPFDVEKLLADLTSAEPVSGEKDGGKTEPGATPPAPDKDDLSRFDQHPRWQEREREMAELKGKLEALQSVVGRPTQPAPPEHAPPPPYRDVTTMTPEDVDDWWEKDKVGFMANFYQQVAYETKNNLMGELHQKETAKTVSNTYETFAATHPDILPMWNDGKINQYMQKNPGHTPISAYYMLREAEGGGKVDGKAMETAVAAAVAEAKKATEQEMIAKFKAKASAMLLGSGPANEAVNATINTDLSVKQAGGMNSFLSQRLAAMRAGGKS